MEFQVGEKVIYPNHGIGMVESIQTRPIPGGKISLYKLRILANDSRVWVPQQNADGVGLRPVIRPAEVRKIFSLLGDGTVDQVANWKGRFKENSDKMRTGQPLRGGARPEGAHVPLATKALSFREKRMLERAKFLIVSEIAEAEDKTRTAVEESVDKALERTFGARAEADPETGRPRQALQRLSPNACVRRGSPSVRPTSRRSEPGYPPRFLDFGGSTV